MFIVLKLVFLTILYIRSRDTAKMIVIMIPLQRAIWPLYELANKLLILSRFSGVTSLN